MVRRTENNRMGLTHSEQFPAPFLLCTNGVPFQWRLCHRCLQAVLACSTNAGKLLCRDAADIDKARAWNTAECLTLCWAAKACVQPAVAAAGDQTAVPAFSPGWQNWGAGSETVCSEANLIGCLSLKGTWAFFSFKNSQYNYTTFLFSELWHPWPYVVGVPFLWVLDALLANWIDRKRGFTSKQSEGFLMPENCMGNMNLSDRLYWSIYNLEQAAQSGCRYFVCGGVQGQADLRSLAWQPCTQ